jgi:hypothetical protein
VQRRSQLYLNWRARNGEWWVKNTCTGGRGYRDKWVQGSGSQYKNKGWDSLLFLSVCFIRILWYFFLKGKSGECF